MSPDSPLPDAPSAASIPPGPDATPPAAEAEVAHRARSWRELPPVTAACCAAVVALFLLTLDRTAGAFAGRAEWAWAPGSAIWGGRWWPLLSSAFLHVDPFHAAFNLYWMWTFGSKLEPVLGRWRLAGLVVLSAWVSSAAQLAASDEMGIGLSGVGYALFGFLWLAGKRDERLKDAVTSRTVSLFLVWLVGCVAVTAAGMYDVGNAAHAAGLVLGALLGIAFSWEYDRRRALGLVLLLTAVATGSLAYAPWSAGWTAHQAVVASARGDHPAAVQWLRRSLARGQQPAWVWQSLASEYAAAGDTSRMRDALEQLRSHDAEAARRFEAQH